METTTEFVTKEKLETVTVVLQKVLKRIEDGEAVNRERDSKIAFLLESSKSKSSSEDFIPQQPKKPINPNAETYTLTLGHGPYTIYRNDGESDRDWAGRKKYLMKLQHYVRNDDQFLATGNREQGEPATGYWIFSPD